MTGCLKKVFRAAKGARRAGYFLSLTVSGIDAQHRTMFCALIYAPSRYKLSSSRTIVVSVDAYVAFPRREDCAFARGEGCLGLG